MSAPDLAWRKSSHSNGNVDCVELAFTAEAVAVRDSKNPDGPALVFPARRLSTVNYPRG